MAVSGLIASLRLAAPALLVSAIACGPAAAQGTPAYPAPGKVVSEHNDWTVRCSDEAAKRVCEATQTLEPAGGKGILAHAAVRAQQGGAVHLIVQVPPGVWLPANVTLKVAGVPDVVLTYKRCGQFCVASTELADAQLSALKASGGTGEMVFEDGSRRPIILPLSFKGLGAAMEASLKKN